MRASEIALLLFAVLCSSVGQIGFKLAAISRRSLLQNVLFCAAGIACMLASVGICTVLLQTMALTTLAPFAALAYITTPLAALIFFQESVNRYFWLGTLLIVIGVMLTLA